MGRAAEGALAPTPHYYQLQGRAAEIARALGSPAGGAEHLFLGMLHDGGWPVSVISPLADLGRAEAAVLAVLSSPSWDRALTREVLNTALTSLGRAEGR